MPTPALPPTPGGSLGSRSWRRLRAATLATYGTRCHLCGRDGADTADHLIPRSMGGTNDLDNLRPAHLSCNASRKDMPLAEWFKAHPLPKTKSKPSRDW